MEKLLENENYAKAHDTWSGKKTKKLPTPREIWLKLAEQYKDKWRYNNEQKTWQIYSDKHWEKAEIRVFTSLVMIVLGARNINYYGRAYIKNVVKLLQLDLLYPHPADTLPVSSGGCLA